MSDNDAVQRGLSFVLPVAARRRDRLILRVCQAATRHVRSGSITLTLPSGEMARLGQNQGGPEAALTFTNLKIFWKALRRGSIGFAEAYMAGDVTSPDLGRVFRFFLANKSALNSAGRGHFRVRLQDKIWHRLRNNTRTGSRRNIAAHYDLGNAFYTPWLDASMTYSSALYVEPKQNLEAAQQHKLDAIVAALDIKPGQRVLEIGCGWGALSERLAREGCHVTAVTVSEEQLAFARARISDAGLADRAQIEFCDYRDLQGQYDRIVSIEMIEAVGEKHWPSYFAALSRHLVPGGHAIIQAITISPEIFANYRAKADFIQRFIFPGGMLPTEAEMAGHGDAAGLRYAALRTFGDSYAETLRAWRVRFDAAWPALTRLGFDERFRRMWIYYLSYCEAGFDHGSTNVGLYRFDKQN
jgi:cyclopropane-fatty-acyl-phospholipid synthase